MSVRLPLLSLGLMLGAAGWASAPVWKWQAGGDGSRVWDLAVANDGSVLAIAGPWHQGAVFLLEGRSGRVLWQRRARAGVAAMPRLSASGLTALYAETSWTHSDTHSHGNVYMLDRKNRVLLRRYTRDFVALSPRGDRIAVRAFPADGGYRFGTKLLDRRGRTLWQSPVMVEDLHFSANGEHLLAAGGDSRVWSSTGEVVWRLAHAPYLPSVSDDGRTLAAREDEPGYLRIVHRGPSGTETHRVLADQRSAADWVGGEAVAVSRSGALVIAVERNPQALTTVLRAFSQDGAARWRKTMPRMPSIGFYDRIVVRPLGRDGFVVVTDGGQSLGCLTVDIRGLLRRQINISSWSARETFRWTLSPDGRKLAVAVGREVRLYSLPTR